MDELAAWIIALGGILIISVIFIGEILSKRKCPNCKMNMKLKSSKENEIIFICKMCGKVVKTGIFGGADD